MSVFSVGRSCGLGLRLRLWFRLGLRRRRCLCFGLCFCQALYLTLLPVFVGQITDCCKQALLARFKIFHTFGLGLCFSLGRFFTLSGLFTELRQSWSWQRRRLLYFFLRFLYFFRRVLYFFLWIFNFFLWNFNFSRGVLKLRQQQL